MKEEKEVKVEKKKSGITAKTLGALKDITERIKESELLNENEMKQWEVYVKLLRNKWIEKNI